MHLWHGIPPAALCPTHRAREWNELRQCIQIVRGAWAFDADWHYAKLIGHVEGGQVILDRISDRAEALATEYARRGERVLTVPDVDVPFVHYGLSPADVREYNAAVLRSKCDDCAAGLDEHLGDKGGPDG